MEFVFVLAYALGLGVLLRWGGRNLPDEKWQMLASVPVRRNADGAWDGLNLTWYGVFNAVAYTLATVTALVLLGSVGVGLPALGCIVIGVLGICAPASKIIARLVEGKPNTLSVGAASFVGILIAPWVAGLAGLLAGPVPVMPALAALAIAYSLGEGVGRLACLSFGCCYGRPVADLSEPWSRILGRWAIVFTGETKKAAYAHQLTGQPLVPVQLMTAWLYCATGVIGMVFFLGGWYGPAMVAPLAVTQVWRVLSEFLRADYRGEQKISAYQIMAVVGTMYGLGLPFVFTAPVSGPDLLLGLERIWTAPVLLMIQAVFVASFLFTGRSSVTGSEVRFHVRAEEI